VEEHKLKVEEWKKHKVKVEEWKKHKLKVEEWQKHKLKVEVWKNDEFKAAEIYVKNSFSRMNWRCEGGRKMKGELKVEEKWMEIENIGVESRVVAKDNL
jgi:hypothetical protein